VALAPIRSSFALPIIHLLDGAFARPSEPRQVYQADQNQKSMRLIRATIIGYPTGGAGAGNLSFQLINARYKTA
jgi:hypothetical protein